MKYIIAFAIPTMMVLMALKDVHTKMEQHPVGAVYGWSLPLIVFVAFFVTAGVAFIAGSHKDL